MNARRNPKLDDEMMMSRCDMAVSSLCPLIPAPFSGLLSPVSILHSHRLLLSALCPLLLFLSFTLNAQEKWTLKECISFGLKNNLQLRNTELSEKLARQSYQQSKWNLLPGINAGSDASMYYGRSVDPTTNGIINNSFFNNSYGLSASVDLFSGFMHQNLIRYQKFRKDAAEYNRISASDDLAFEVMTAFYNVIYYEEFLKIAIEQKALSELNVKKTEILVSTGLKAQTELLEVRAQLEKDELICIQTSNNIESSWISLKKAMNLSPDLQITLSEPEENPITIGEITAIIPELFKLHSVWSPRIRSVENEWKASQKDVNVRKAGYFPSIQLQAAFNTGYYETNLDVNNRIISFNDQIRNNQRQYIGASLSIPVFNKNSARFGVLQSKIILSQAETKLELAKRDLLFEMEKNYNDLTASWKELQQAERQFEADKLSFQAAQKKFDQGMINAVDFYTVKNRMANTTGQVLHSKLTLEIKKRTLDFYKGERFWERKPERKRETGDRTKETGNELLDSPLSSLRSPVYSQRTNT
jgi:outer membrane protein